MELQIKAKNYRPLQLEFLGGGSITGENFMMVADYEKAQNIVKTLLKKDKQIDSVSMGLDGDWRWHSCTIWEDDVFVPYEDFEGSFWAEPIIIVYYKNGTNEAYSCWKKEDKY